MTDNPQGFGSIVQAITSMIGGAVAPKNRQTLAASLDTMPATANVTDPSDPGLTLEDLRAHAEKLSALIDSHAFVESHHYDHTTLMSADIDPLQDPVLELAETNKRINEHPDNPHRSTTAMDPEPPILLPEPPTLTPDDPGVSL